MRKAALHNLGCKVNAYETEAMKELLQNAGYEIVPFQEKADVYVINTCSVTNVADKKSRQMLHRAKKLNPKAVVVAVGCYVQAAEETLKDDPSVDLVIGNNMKNDIVRFLDEYFARHASDTDDVAEESDPGNTDNDDIHVIDINDTGEYEDLKVSEISDHTRAFLKIQDGCNQFCSYCIIPIIRGRIRSREMSDVVSEAEALIGSGYEEIVLTGIHLSSYGLDLYGEHTGLLDLIVRLDQIPGLKRLRMGSLEPRIVTEEFAGTLAGLRTICPHFHLSLQSGSDTVLKRMNRHYTTREYAKGCDILRKYFDDPAITTDVIVGFPQETDEEFEETVRFAEQIHFYEMHVFKYSMREGTKAAVMPGQVSSEVKDTRSKRLIELGRKMSEEYRRHWLGMEKEVLMEEKAEIGGTDYLVGHTKEYVKAAIPWNEDMRGRFVTGTLKSMLNDEILLLE